MFTLLLLYLIHSLAYSIPLLNYIYLLNFYSIRLLSFHSIHLPTFHFLEIYLANNYVQSVEECSGLQTVFVFCLYLPLTGVSNICLCSLRHGPFLSSKKTNSFGYAADKCGWREEELLPWRQATPVARRAGAPELVARYSCCREP